MVAGDAADEMDLNYSVQKRENVTEYYDRVLLQEHKTRVTGKFDEIAATACLADFIINIPEPSPSSLTTDRPVRRRAQLER